MCLVFFKRKKTYKSPFDTYPNQPGDNKNIHSKSKEQNKVKSLGNTAGLPSCSPRNQGLCPCGGCAGLDGLLTQRWESAEWG